MARLPSYLLASARGPLASLDTVPAARALDRGPRAAAPSLAMRHEFASLPCGALVHASSRSVQPGDAALRCAMCGVDVALRRGQMRPHFAAARGETDASGPCGGGRGTHLRAKGVVLHRFRDLVVSVPACSGCGRVRRVALGGPGFDARLVTRESGAFFGFDIVVACAGVDMGVIEVRKDNPVPRGWVDAVVARGLWYAEFRAAEILALDAQHAPGTPIHPTNFVQREWVSGGLCPAGCVRPAAGAPPAPRGDAFATLMSSAQPRAARSRPRGGKRRRRDVAASADQPPGLVRRSDNTFYRRGADGSICEAPVSDR